MEQEHKPIRPLEPDNTGAPAPPSKLPPATCEGMQSHIKRLQGEILTDIETTLPNRQARVLKEAVRKACTKRMTLIWRSFHTGDPDTGDKPPPSCTAGK